MTAQVIEAELTWTGGRFEPGIRVAVGADGRIQHVGAVDAPVTRRLPRRALLPGFVNAHSHAFQRGLRGRGERFPAGAGSFWTWREAMYALVTALDPDGFRQWCVQAFAEMRDAGITAVGEFHYLHHPGEDEDFVFDALVLEAARHVGIRLVLLESYYRTGGIGRPLSEAQRRFATATPERYWAQMDRLGTMLDPATQSLGAVVHSIRAADLNDLRAVHGEAVRRNLPFHMHVEEQPSEIDDCVAAYGRTPLATIRDTLDVGPSFTAVHCTHSTAEDIREFVAAGGGVCICPLTEANLGDGIPASVTAIRAAGGRISLGTDSNARISMTEEMRWLEYAQRLAGGSRGVLRDADGAVAPVLLRAATLDGAHSLGLDAGTIAPGAWADFCAVDLSAAALAGADADTLADALVFGAGDDVVAATCVGGKWREGQAQKVTRDR